MIRYQAEVFGDLRLQHLNLEMIKSPRRISRAFYTRRVMDRFYDQTMFHYALSFSSDLAHLSVCTGRQKK